MQFLHVLLACFIATAGLVESQTSSISVKYSLPCSIGHYFDTSTLQCGTCTQGSLPAPDPRYCSICDNSTGSVYTFNDGVAANLTWAPASIQSSACVCSAASPTSVVTDVQLAGQYYKKCITCPAGTTPDSTTGSCQPSTSAGAVKQTDLAYVLATLNARGASLNSQTATQASWQNVLQANGRTQLVNIAPSQPLQELLGPAARQCMEQGSQDACNALANLCTLQMYSSDAVSCQLYDELVALQTGGSSTVAKRRASTSASSPKPDTGALPWLYYQGQGYSKARDVGLRVTLGRGGGLAKGAVSELSFVLSVYSLNGSWLGYWNWTSQLQLCGAHASESSKWTTFATDYSNACTLSLDQLLAQQPLQASGPLLFEAFLQDGPSSLYPLPVKVANKVEASGSAADMEQIGHVRRFFLLDTSMGTKASGSGSGSLSPFLRSTTSSAVVQYASELSLEVAIQADQRNAIYPPVLKVRYQAATTEPDAGVSLPTSFSMTYTNDPALEDAFWYSWRTMIIVFAVLVGAPVWAWRMMLYLRKRTNTPIDLDVLLYALLAAADAMSFALCIVLLLVSLYWLITIKMQEEVQLLMLRDHQVANFRVTVLLAMVGQAVGLAALLWRQVRVDVFFIDWEKPRRVLAKGGGREDLAPISCWRTLLAANEWNELQTRRITSPGFTMMAIAAILGGLNLQAAGYISPDTGDYSTYSSVDSSIILRFGITAAFFLVLDLAQVVVKALVVHRFFSHPLAQYVDLLFLANCSCIILDDNTSGYYLHGRNQVQHSDTDMAELNQGLLLEERGLVANRGLVTCYQDDPQLNDVQTFAIHVPEELRQRYDRQLLAQVEAAAQEQRLRQGLVRSTVLGPQRAREALVAARDHITSLLKHMVDEVERNHATQVVVPSYWQRVFRLPPQLSSMRAVFMHDFHDSFADTIFWGHELRLAVFEALLCCAVDMAIHNIVLAAFTSFCVMRALAWIRSWAGENNLSRKTLVDRHFLI